MRSVMKHQFSQVPQANIPRSKFNRSHGHKTTFDAGKLIPFFVDEALPGDTFNLRTTLFARLATPIFPIMDNMHMDTFYFAVPLRLVWENWQRFNGEQDSPNSSTDFLVPQYNYSGFTHGSLSDYFGLPAGVRANGGSPVPASAPVSALFHRAYWLIWDEWFRDQNTEPSMTPFIGKGDGPDNADINNDTNGDTGGTPMAMFYDVPAMRNKNHDYFTSCLPWPQKGPGMEIPIGGLDGEIPITGSIQTTISAQQLTAGVYASFTTQDNSGTPASGTNTLNRTGQVPSGAFGTVAALQNSVGNGATPTSGVAQRYAGGLVASSIPLLQVEIGSDDQQAFTINALREAFQLQKLLERDARGGTRYTEILRSHFGVISPDARLQRPEYLGGSSARIIINPVAQTASTDETSPQGNLSAFGLVSDSRGGFVKSFVEHCIIIGLVNVRSDLTYSQGINRMWSRQTRYDFYWPALAHLGEQAVYNREIFADGKADTVTDPTGNTYFDGEVFGYQERWAEYRYKPSLVTGAFRPDFSTNIAAWHLSQRFTERPGLNAKFLMDFASIEGLDRALAVPSEPHFIFDSYINLICARPMPVYSVPGLIDHF